MITLYDLVFQEDRRPSPFCWRAKFALKHKGLDWRDEPTGFTEKQRSPLPSRRPFQSSTTARRS